MRFLWNTTEGRILLVIFLVGLALRVTGLSFGLPHLYLEDEPFFTNPAIRVAQGSLNPQWFGAPGQPLIYGVALIFRITNKVINIMHGSTGTISTNYQHYITLFQTVARTFPALVGALSVFPAYWIISRWSKRAGLFAAGFIASSFALVDESHIIRPDILQTFFILWMILFIVLIAEQPQRWRWYILFGVSFALGITTKFPTLFLTAPLGVLLFALWKNNRLQIHKWLYACGATVLATFISGPYLFLNFRRMLHDVGIEGRVEKAGHDHFNFLQNLWWYISHVLNFQLGTILGGLIIVATVVVLARGWRKRPDKKVALVVLLTATSAFYLVILSFLHLHWERWTTPVMVVELLVAGIGMDMLFAWRVRRFVLTLIITLLLTAPTLRLARTLYGYTHPDTIDIAAMWVAEHVPPGSTIAEEPYTPELNTATYRVLSVPNISWYDYDGYIAKDVKYIVTSSFIDDTIAQEAKLLGSSSVFAKAVIRYDVLRLHSRQLYLVTPHPVYSTEQLIMSNDLSVFRTLDIHILRGPTIRVSELQ